MTDVLADRVTRVAMSKFGQAAMPEAEVVLHGVDTAIFKPVDRREAKVALGYEPDDFLVVRTDKNSLRKDYASTYFALRPLMRQFSDIRVHFHCQMRSPDGYDLRALMWNDEDIRDRVNFSQGLGGYTGWPEGALALLMAAADLHVSTSWGEGFGLNLLQSLACGTPVIATDCSAITEVVGDGGILIPPKWAIAAPMGQLHALPDVEAFTAAIGHYHQSAGLRRDLRANAIAHAATMTWDYAAAAFDRIVRREVEKTRSLGLIPELVT
jgi:glycosyltransferase involved in cell wall biosynthesis